MYSKNKFPPHLRRHDRSDVSSLFGVYLPMEDPKAIFEKVSFMCTCSPQSDCLKFPPRVLAIAETQH